MLARLIRDCGNCLAWWSVAGLCYGAAALLLSQPPGYFPALVGLALLAGIATLWAFYRRLRWAHGYLTRYDNPTKEK